MGKKGTGTFSCQSNGGRFMKKSVAHFATKAIHGVKMKEFRSTGYLIILILILLLSFPAYGIAARVTQTGSGITIQSSSQNGSQSVTVPADATLCVVMASMFENATNWITANPVTLNGVNLTTLQRTDDQSVNDHAWIGYLVNPSTGSQTLAWNWGTTPDQGAIIYVVFYKGVDTSNPVVSSGKQTTNGQDLTGLTAGVGDMMVGIVSTDTSVTSVTDQGGTELARTSSAFNNIHAGVASKLGGTGFYFTGGTYTACAAGVFRGTGASVNQFTYSNTNSITIRDNNTASPYPSSITVPSVSGTVTKVTVTITGLSHTYPDDIRMLLVGPTGQTCYFMGEKGGDPDVSGVNLTFDDGAGSELPEDTQITSGTYRPSPTYTQYDFPSPAPATPYGTTLYGYSEKDPAGTWSLYVWDYSGSDSGSISGGWQLTLTVVSGSAEIGSFSYRKQITIDYTRVGSSCTGSLSNIPVLIKITGDNDLKTVPTGHVENSNGYDIIFRAADGATQLDHEIESYSGTSGNLEAWVKIPTLSITANTIIYMYYGNSEISSPTQNPVGVWSNNYKGVWHLQETSGSYLDSTGNNNTGTATVTSRTATARIGTNAPLFDSATSNNINCGTGSSLDFSGDMTLEAWIYPTGWGGGGFGTMIDRGAGSDMGYQFYIRQLSTSLSIYDGTSLQGNIGSITLDGWQHVVVVVSGGNNASFYVNGVGAGSGSWTFAAVGSATFYIGNFSSMAETFAGTIDEVRASNVARNACWVETEYNNQNWPNKTQDGANGFLTVGNEEVLGVFENRRPIIINQLSGACDTNFENLSNFPVLVNLSADWLKTKANGGKIYSSNGHDIVFRASDGTTSLDHEVEYYDGSGTGISFVRSGGISDGIGFSFDIGSAGTSRLVVVIAGNESTGTNLSGVVVDGNACNLIAIADNPNGAGNHQEMWYCDEDDLGASNGVVTVAIAGGGATWGVQAHLYTGVSQSGPTDYGVDQTSVNLTTVTVTGIDVPANGLVVMGAGEGTDGYTVNSWTSPLAQRQSEPGHPTSADLISSSGIEASQQTNKTYVATFSGTFNRGTGIVASFAPAGSGEGKLVAWVKIPTLYYNQNTTIYMYYGNESITSPTENPTGVWDDGGLNYYKGVWHLKESVTNNVTTAGVHVDSTSNNNDGTQVNNDDLSAKIYNGQDFEGDLRDEYLEIPNSTSMENVQEGDYTVEAWFFPDTLPPGTPPAYNAYYAIVGKEGWNLGLEMLNSGHFTMNHWLAVGPTNENAVGGAKSAATWYHVVGVVSKTDGYTKIYVNGVNEATNTFTAGSAALEYGTAPWRIGIWAPGQQAYDGPANGKIDEVRISNVARSACWIETCYSNQNNPGGFIILGGEEAPAPTLVKLKSFTATQYQEGVLLKWKTGYEVNNLGFHIYREENRQLVRLTPEPVAGSALLAGSRTPLTAGHHYHWWNVSAIADVQGPLTLKDRPLASRTVPQVAGLEGKESFASSEALLERSAPQAERSAIHYWLKDIDLNGTETMHGPLTPVICREPPPAKFKPELLSEVGWRLNEKYHQYWKARELKERLNDRYRSRSTSFKDRFAQGALTLEAKQNRLLASSPAGTLLKARRAGPRGNSVPDPQTQWSLASRAAVKLFVKEEGWYRVTQPELVAVGLNPRANPHHLQLYADGQEQPIHVIGGKDGRFGPRDAIEFYGVGLDTPSTDTRAYWLIEGTKPGKRIHEFKSHTGSLGSLSSSSFPHTVEVKDRWIYLPAIKNGEEENFFGAVVYGSGADQLLGVKHLDLGASEDALLEVALQGATNVSHRVRVLLNKEDVGEIVFEGQSKGLLQVEVPQSLLLEGDNLVSFVPLDGDMDISLVHSIRLTYWHTNTADDNALKFTASGGGHLTLSGFSHPKIRVLDITDSNEVIEVFGKVESQKGSYAVSFRVPGTSQRTLLAIAGERVKIVEGMVSNQPSSWHQVKEGYDLVIVTHRDFFDALQPLKKLRESQGLRVALIDVEDLYDEFSSGNKSPKAIKDFLASAKTKWRKPPRFVLLVGDASFDSRNYLGSGELDFVPTKLIDTVYLETASDDWFVDFNNDGLPEMAIGRIPVQTVEEAAIVVSKIVGYEKSVKKNEALLVADRSDNSDDYDFEGASEEIWGLLPSSLVVRKIYRGQFSSDAQAKGELLRGINQGPLLVNFIGHGSIEIWRGNILTSDDAEGLINGMRLPFFVNMTCLNGYFQDPYSETLGEALIKAKGGGAIAVWTSSGLTEPDKQAVMNKELIKLLFNGQLLTLGEVTARAKASVTDQDIRKTWILFGDPTTRLKP